MTTAVRVEPAPRIPFLARYTKGELTGMHVERGRLCNSCRARYFPQQVINPDYYNALPAGSRDYFLQSCEIERHGRRLAAWFPRFCHKCVRRTL